MNEIDQKTFNWVVELNARIYAINTELDGNDKLTLARKLALRREKESLIEQRAELLKNSV